MMEKHWTSFLSEAGKPLLNMGFSQEQILLRINQKKKEIDQLEQEYMENERIIMQSVMNDWTPEEIEKAKNPR
jgi:adenylate kinase family enzyme